MSLERTGNSYVLRMDRTGGWHAPIRFQITMPGRIWKATAGQIKGSELDWIKQRGLASLLVRSEVGGDAWIWLSALVAAALVAAAGYWSRLRLAPPAQPPGSVAPAAPGSSQARGSAQAAEKSCSDGATTSRPVARRGSCGASVRMRRLFVALTLALAASLGSSQEPALVTNPSQFKFSATAGTNPPSQTLLVAKFGQRKLEWTAKVRTATGGDWLSVEPHSGVAPTKVTVSVVATGLDPGNHRGAIQVLASESPDNPKVIPVTLTVTPP